MEADEQGETPRQVILREQKKEAQQEGICARCLGNAGLRIKVKENGFCPSCGCMGKPKFNKI
jgi:hypothetical protein